MGRAFGFGLLFLLPRLCWSACEAPFRDIQADIKHIYRMELSCSELEKAARLLPVRSVEPALGTWTYPGEEELRDALWRRYQVRVSSSILPVGRIERRSPEGDGWLLVFGIEMPQRAWGVLAVAQHEGPPPPQGAAAILGEGAVYDWVGFYPLPPASPASGTEAIVSPDPSKPRAGQWLKLEAGGAWPSAEEPPVGEARACLTCEGWLCPRRPIACFSDFDLDGREETMLIDDCQPHACGLRLLEPDEKGLVRVLFDEPGVYGQWTRRADGWILVPEVYCPWGEFCGAGDASLGNPNCERPDVYRMLPSGLIKADTALRDEYFPIENRSAPAGCAVDADGAVVYAKDGRFARYLPR